MNDLKNNLAQRIEEVLRKKSALIQDWSRKDTLELVEELSIYHQELEYQNIELMRTRLNLEEANSLLQDLFLHAPVGYIMCDQNLYIQKANNAFIKILNLEHNPAGARLTDYIHPKYQDIFYLFFSKLKNNLLTDDESCIIECVVSNCDSCVHTVKIHAFKVSTSESEYYLISFTPLDTEVELIEELKREQEDIVKIDRLKTEFLNNLSHNIRSPLNVINNYVKMIGEGDNEIEFSEMVNAIERSTLDLTLSIDYLARFAMFKTGVEKITYNSIHVSDLLNEINELSIVYQFQKKPSIVNYSLKNLSEDDVLLVDGDKTRFIVKELVYNALKFSHGEPVALSLILESDFLKIVVTDNASMIPQYVVDGLSDNYAEVDSIFHSKGFQFGLKLVYHYIQLLGGSLNFYTKDIKGNVVECTVPIHSCKDLHASSLSGPLRHGAVLIYSPDKRVSDYLEWKIAAFDIKPYVCTTAFEAEGILERNCRIRMFFVYSDVFDIKTNDFIMSLKSRFPGLAIVAILNRLIYSSHSNYFNVDHVLYYPVLSKELSQLLRHHFTI